MKLRNKVLISIGLVWAGFLMITYVASYFFLHYSFLLLFLMVLFDMNQLIDRMSPRWIRIR